MLLDWFIDSMLLGLAIWTLAPLLVIPYFVIWMIGYRVQHGRWSN